MILDAWEDMTREQKQEQEDGVVVVVVVVIEFGNVDHHLFVMLLQFWAVAVIIVPTP